MNDTETILMWLEKQSHIEISRQLGTPESPVPLYLIKCGLGGRTRSVQSATVKDGLFCLMALEHPAIPHSL